MDAIYCPPQDLQLISSGAIDVLPEPPDHRYRLRVMEAVCAWEFGDHHWAERLLAAYTDPRTALAKLQADGGDLLD